MLKSEMGAIVRAQREVIEQQNALIEWLLKKFEQQGDDTEKQETSDGNTREARN